jgi:hypothetical protein
MEVIMKKTRSFLFFFCLGIVLATTFTLSCDSGGGGNRTLRNSDMALQNSDMEFMDSAIPTGQTAYIQNVRFNGDAIAGGSSSITVTSSEQLRELYLQVESENGYYVRQLSESDLVSNEIGLYVYFILLQFSQQLEGGALQFTVSGTTMQQAISSVTENTVQIIRAGTGALQISLSWDENDDVDLHVYTPSGNEVYFGRKRIAATESVGEAELDIDSNAGCGIDGKNTENIYFESPLESGKYTVKVCLFDKCSSGTAGARYNVSANRNGQFIPFSPNQSGKFADSDSYKCIEIGTITIN